MSDGVPGARNSAMFSTWVQELAEGRELEAILAQGSDGQGEIPMSALETAAVEFEGTHARLRNHLSGKKASGAHRFDELLAGVPGRTERKAGASDNSFSGSIAESTASASVHNGGSSVHSGESSVRSGDLPVEGGGTSSAPSESPPVSIPSEQATQEWARLQEIAAPIRAKRRAHPDTLRKTLLELCAVRPLSLAELSELTARTPDTLRIHHIALLLHGNLLSLSFPDQPTNPRQSYVTARSRADSAAGAEGDGTGEKE